jgi:hypothetical protein
VRVEGEERLVEETVEFAITEAQLKVTNEEVIMNLVAVAHEIYMVMTFEFFNQIDASLRNIKYH